MTTGLFSLGSHVDRAGTEWEVGSIDEANVLLARHHYLGQVSPRGGELVIIGSSDGVLTCAQVWRLPTARMLPNDGTWLELSRWCLTPAAGPNAGSRQHRAAVRVIRADRPEVTTLVSYSDPSHGHTGSLYRACNWEWWPTWHRLRTPPTGNGAWQEGKAQAVKDRWLFEVRPDPRRAAVVRIDDAGAIRHWAASATDAERAWARTHPQLMEAL